MGAGKAGVLLTYTDTHMENIHYVDFSIELCNHQH